MIDVGSVSGWEFQARSMDLTMSKYLYREVSLEQLRNVFSEKVPLLAQEVIREIGETEGVTQSISRGFYIGKIMFIGVFIPSAFHFYTKWEALINIDFQSVCLPMRPIELLEGGLGSVFFFFNAYYTMKAAYRAFFHLSREKTVLLSSILRPIRFIKNIWDEKMGVEQKKEVPYSRCSDEDSSYVILESIKATLPALGQLNESQIIALQSVEDTLERESKKTPLSCLSRSTFFRMSYVFIIASYLYFLVIDGRMFYTKYNYNFNNHSFEECKKILETDFSVLLFTLAIYFIIIGLVFMSTSKAGDTILHSRQKRFRAIEHVYEILGAAIQSSKEP